MGSAYLLCVFGREQYDEMCKAVAEAEAIQTACGKGGVVVIEKGYTAQVFGVIRSATSAALSCSLSSASTSQRSSVHARAGGRCL